MGSIERVAGGLSIRDAVSCAAATLVAYVGLVHEVVGATLYPEGPLELGGPLVWHGLGLAGIAAGSLMAAGTLRVLRVPVKLLAAVVGVIGGGVFAAEVLEHGGFHFFACTLVVASAILVLGGDRGGSGANVALPRHGGRATTTGDELPTTSYQPRCAHHTACDRAGAIFARLRSMVARSWSGLIGLAM
jgi:hypothetical protein